MMLLTALTIAAALQAAGPGVWRETETPVAQLIGRSPAEVAERLGAPPEPTAEDAVRIVSDGRTVDVYPMTRFWKRPGQGEGCVTGFPDLSGRAASATPGQALSGRNRGVLVFEDGRLVGVHPDPERPRTEGPVTREGARDLVYGPRPASPFPVAAGRLPLSDGLGALGRLQPPPEGLTIASACRELPERTTRGGDVGTDLIWGMVGLVVLPTVPFVRTGEDRAEREGGALLASVQPGAVLPGGADAFVARRRGVRLYRDAADPGFAVVAIRLGNGTDNVADIGLLGVRDDRVIWRVEREAAQASGLRALMCLDGENRPGRVRPGCSTTGFLSP